MTTFAEELVLELTLAIVRCMDRRVMLGLPAIPKQRKKRRRK